MRPRRGDRPVEDRRHRARPAARDRGAGRACAGRSAAARTAADRAAAPLWSLPKVLDQLIPAPVRRCATFTSACGRRLRAATPTALLRKLPRATRALRSTASCAVSSDRGRRSSGSPSGRLPAWLDGRGTRAVKHWARGATGGSSGWRCPTNRRGPRAPSLLHGPAADIARHAEPGARDLCSAGDLRRHRRHRIMSASTPGRRRARGCPDPPAAGSGRPGDTRRQPDRLLRVAPTPATPSRRRGGDRRRHLRRRRRGGEVRIDAAAAPLPSARSPLSARRPGIRAAMGGRARRDQSRRPHNRAADGARHERAHQLRPGKSAACSTGFGTRDPGARAATFERVNNVLESVVTEVEREDELSR